MIPAWPWVAFAALGAYHGINPAMGWLFAVALGMQEKSRRAVLRALPPIALGHLASLVGAVLLVGATQAILPEQTARFLSAAVILAWGLLRLIRSRHPRWVGMRVGPWDLVVWSFVMSSAHGAGLMLVPVLLQCHFGPPLSGGAAPPAPPALLDAGQALLAHPGFLAAAVGLHTASLLLAAGGIALLVYERLGVSFLRRAWVNLDLLWSGALLGAGVAILAL